MAHFRPGDEARFHQGVQGAQKCILGRGTLARLPVFSRHAGVLAGQNTGARRQFLRCFFQRFRAEQRGDIRLVRPRQGVVPADIAAKRRTPGRGGLAFRLESGPQIDRRAGRGQPRHGVSRKGGKGLIQLPPCGQQQRAFQQQTGQGRSQKDIGSGIVAGRSQIAQFLRLLFTQRPQQMLVQKIVQRRGFQLRQRIVQTEGRRRFAGKITGGGQSFSVGIGVIDMRSGGRCPGKI